MQPDLRSSVAVAFDLPGPCQPQSDGLETCIAGIKEEVLSVQVIAKDVFGGNVLVENLAHEPLTVGVQVLPQDGFGFGDDGGGSGGQNQSIGGGAFGGGQGGGYGGGLFSIPAERVVRMPYNSVCLERGKPDPQPCVQYRLVSVAEYTDNVQLQEVIKLVASGCRLSFFDRTGVDLRQNRAIPIPP